jgi:hypothetical protein
MPPIKVKTDSGHKIPETVAQLLEPDEHVLNVVHKSIIVLIGLYLEVVAAVVAFGFLIGVLSPNTVTRLFDGSAASLLILILVVALVIVILVLLTNIYLQNELVINDKSLIEVTQHGPFSNKASRLSFSNVEDVSGTQSGFLATAFNFGTLMVQTAGTMDNFIFTYCPSPNKYAHQILVARQAYAEALREANENRSSPQNTQTS